MWTMIMPSNHVVIRFKCWLQICTNMNDLKFDFSKKNQVGTHQAPSLDPSPDPSRVYTLASLSVWALPLILMRGVPSTQASSPSIIGPFAPSVRTFSSISDWGIRLGP